METLKPQKNDERFLLDVERNVLHCDLTGVGGKPHPPVPGVIPTGVR